MLMKLQPPNINLKRSMVASSGADFEVHTEMNSFSKEVMQRVLEDGGKESRRQLSCVCYAAQDAHSESENETDDKEVSDEKHKPANMSTQKSVDDDLINKLTDLNICVKTDSDKESETSCLTQELKTEDVKSTLNEETKHNAPVKTLESHILKKYENSQDNDDEKVINDKYVKNDDNKQTQNLNMNIPLDEVVKGIDNLKLTIEKKEDDHKDDVISRGPDKRHQIIGSTRSSAVPYSITSPSLQTGGSIITQISATQTFDIQNSCSFITQQSKNIPAQRPYSPILSEKDYISDEVVETLLGIRTRDCYKSIGKREPTVENRYQPIAEHQVPCVNPLSPPLSDGGQDLSMFSSPPPYSPYPPSEMMSPISISAESPSIYETSSISNSPGSPEDNLMDILLLLGDNYAAQPTYPDIHSNPQIPNVNCDSINIQSHIPIMGETNHTNNNHYAPSVSSAMMSPSSISSICDSPSVSNSSSISDSPGSPRDDIIFPGGNNFVSMQTTYDDLYSNLSVLPTTYNPASNIINPVINCNPISIPEMKKTNNINDEVFVTKMNGTSLNSQWPVIKGEPYVPRTESRSAFERLNLDPEKNRKAFRDLALIDEEKLSASDNDGDTILLIMIAKRLPKGFEYLYALVKRLAKIPGALAAKNSQKQSALLLACMYMHDKPLVARFIADMLYSINYDLNEEVYDNGNTIIHWLCERGDLYLNVLVELLSMRNEAGLPCFDINKHNYSTGTPLNVAVKAHGQHNVNCSGIITFLVSQGANVTERERCGGRTSLHIAIKESGDPLIVQILLKAADRQGKNLVNSMDYQRDTALHYAHLRNDLPLQQQLRIITLLIQYGATNVTGSQGRMPLALVMPPDRKEIIRANTQRRNRKV